MFLVGSGIPDPFSCLIIALEINPVDCRSTVVQSAGLGSATFIPVRIGTGICGITRLGNLSAGVATLAWATRPMLDSINPRDKYSQQLAEQDCHTLAST
jgi:hypothetical protein